MCAGVPAYQAGGGDGPVLFRTEVSSGRTRWWVVGPSFAGHSALETCSYRSRTYYLGSAYSDQPGGGPPTAPAYSAGHWAGINVTAGGR
jgi:hypothetical protein